VDLAGLLRGQIATLLDQQRYGKKVTGGTIIAGPGASSLPDLGATVRNGDYSALPPDDTQLRTLLLGLDGQLAHDQQYQALADQASKTAGKQAVDYAISAWQQNHNLTIDQLKQIANDQALKVGKQLLDTNYQQYLDGDIKARQSALDIFVQQPGMTRDDATKHLQWLTDQIRKGADVNQLKLDEQRHGWPMHGKAPAGGADAKDFSNNESSAATDIFSKDLNNQVIDYNKKYHRDWFSPDPKDWKTYTDATQTFAKQAAQTKTHQDIQAHVDAANMATAIVDNLPANGGGGNGNGSGGKGGSNGGNGNPSGGHSLQQYQDWTKYIEERNKQLDSNTATDTIDRVNAGSQYTPGNDQSTVAADAKQQFLQQVDQSKKQDATYQAASKAVKSFKPWQGATVKDETDALNTLTKLNLGDTATELNAGSKTGSSATPASPKTTPTPLPGDTATELNAGANTGSITPPPPPPPPPAQSTTAGHGSLQVK